MRMRPALTLSSPDIVRSMVDLPQPEGPTKHTELPVFDLEVDAVDGEHRTEALGNSFQYETRHRQPLTAPIVIPLMK